MLPNYDYAYLDRYIMDYISCTQPCPKLWIAMYYHCSFNWSITARDTVYRSYLSQAQDNSSGTLPSSLDTAGADILVPPYLEWLLQLRPQVTLNVRIGSYYSLY